MGKRRLRPGHGSELNGPAQSVVARHGKLPPSAPAGIAPSSAS